MGSGQQIGSGQPLPDSVPAALVRGSLIGRYIVLAMVGRGGMGEVYAAYDPEMDRKVAVKLLRVKPGNGVSLSEGRTRTLREAQAIARLSHPNVVIAYDVGTFEDKVFIAMEYVEGNTVTYWLQVQQRSWREILRVFIDAGRGLAAAHEKGLVHRDFKTDNVMVSRDRHVRVMDFGLARQVQDRAAPPAPAQTSTPAAPTAAAPVVAHPIPIRILASGSSVDGDGPQTIVVTGDHEAPIPIEGRSNSGMFDARLTRTGAMMGTPAYMAPEQFLGTPTDARSDQFSFCISLYEALYGERPFEGASMTTLTANVVQGNVRAAPANSKVPLWVRRVLLRGLQPRVRDRWPSMEAMLEALQKDPNIARRKWAAAAAGAAVISGLAFGGWRIVNDKREVCSGGPPKLAGIWDLRQQGEPEPARHAQIRKAFMQTGKSYAPDVFVTVSRALTTYAQNWANMYKDACEATEVRREQSSDVMDLRMACLQERLGGVRALTEVFSEASGDVVENAVSAANALTSLDRCADVPLLRAVVRPPDDPRAQAQVAQLRRELAELKARFDAGRWKEARKRAAELIAEARTLRYDPLVAEILTLAGRIYGRANEIEAAEKAMVEAYWVADSSRHDEVRAEAATNLVFVVGYQHGHFDDAERWATAANSVLRRLGGHELLQGWLLNDLGCVHDLRGDKEGAVRLMLQGLELKIKALGRDHPDVGFSEANVGMSLQGLGRSAEALTHLDRAVTLVEKGLGTGHPELAMDISNRSEVLNALGRHAEARAGFERARAVWERELGSENLNLGYALTGIGLSYLGENNPNSALVPLERAFRIREAQELEPSRRAETRFALSRALWDSHRDRGRAIGLATEANATYLKTGSRSKAAEVNAWLNSRSVADARPHLSQR